MVIVETNKGKIKGVKESDHLYFLGIPYAKPPVGNLRFFEPQVMEKWDAVKDATEFGSIPPQGWVDTPPIDQEEDEDCLYLNIWTPAVDDKARPVMFWIHGGGFMIGAGSRSRLNGAKLAVHSDVVVVNFNYRLGVLGFLNLPEIPPNIGILDQIASLKWVRENIKKFGGNPQNVTIFGESAGGSSVAILLTIPVARGLFHKAIMQSGVAHPRNFGTRRSREGAQELLSKLGIERKNIDQLKTVPLQELMRWQKHIAGGIMDVGKNPFQPWIDGKVIPENPIDIIRKGEASNVPVIIGNNRDELGQLSNMLNHANETNVKNISDNFLSRIRILGKDDKVIDELIEIYKRELNESHPNNPYKYLDTLLSDSMFTIPIIRTLEEYSKHQPNSYRYIFTYGSNIDGIAFHTIEIPFVFGNLDTKDTQEGAIGNGKKEQDLSKNVMDAWVNFAQTGDPNHEGIPKWTPFDVKKRATMMLGVISEQVEDPNCTLRKAWKNIL